MSNNSIEREVTAVVVVMTDGEKDYARRSIESAIKQTISIEVLVIANKDLKWIRELEKLFIDKVSFIYTEKIYASKARNLSGNYCKTNYLAFLDGDDIWYPEKIEKQLKIAKANNSKVIGADHILIDESGKPFCYGICKNIAMTSSWLIKKEYFIKNKFDESLTKDEDAEWWIRCHNKQEFSRLSEVLIGYTVRENSLSSQTKSKKRKEQTRRMAENKILRELILIISKAIRWMHLDAKYHNLKSWGNG